MKKGPINGENETGVPDNRKKKANRFVWDHALGQIKGKEEKRKKTGLVPTLQMHGGGNATVPGSSKKETPGEPRGGTGYLKGKTPLKMTTQSATKKLYSKSLPKKKKKGEPKTVAEPDLWGEIPAERNLGFSEQKRTNQGG